MSQPDESAALLGPSTTSKPQPPAQPTSAARTRDFILGIALLLLVVALWTASSFITNQLETGDYNKPWLLTYLGTASFSLYLVKPAFYHLCRLIPLPTGVSTLFNQNKAHQHEDHHESTRSSWSATPSVHPELTLRQTLSLAFEFCLLWFAANYTLALSLSWTSVSSSTILSATSGLFAMACGSLLGFSDFTFKRFFAVLISLIGVIVVSRSDSEMTAQPNEKPPSRPLLGDTMALLSALCYACYVSLIKIRAGQESRLDMPKFLGFVGLINIVLLWPTGLLLHLTGIETFEAPRSRSLFLAIVVNSFITFVSDFLYIVSMLLTTPLTVTLGLSLTIPLAIFGDMALGHAFGGWKAVCGAALVVASFAIVGWADKEEEARVSETD